MLLYRAGFYNQDFRANVINNKKLFFVDTLIYSLDIHINSYPAHLIHSFVSIRRRRDLIMVADHETGYG
jgi:hypothetical protein